MFECFLFAPVHDLESAAEIGNGAAIFKLRKVDAVMWPSLQSLGSGKLFIVHFLYGFSCCLFVSAVNQIFRFVVRILRFFSQNSHLFNSYRYVEKLCVWVGVDYNHM